MKKLILVALLFPMFCIGQDSLRGWAPVFGAEKVQVRLPWFLKVIRHKGKWIIVKIDESNKDERPSYRYDDILCGHHGHDNYDLKDAGFMLLGVADKIEREGGRINVDKDGYRYRIIYSEDSTELKRFALEVIHKMNPYYKTAN